MMGSFRLSAAGAHGTRCRRKKWNRRASSRGLQRREGDPLETAGGPDKAGAAQPGPTDLGSDDAALATRSVSGCGCQQQVDKPFLSRYA